MLLGRVKAKSFTGGAVSNQDLPFEGPPEELHLVTLVMQCLWAGYLKHPAGQAFQEVLGERRTHLFPFLDSISECLCWYQTDSLQCRSLYCASEQGADIAFTVWAANSERASAAGVSSPSLTVHFICLSEHRLLASCDPGSTNQQHFRSITWADVMMIFVTYSFIPPCSCYSVKSVTDPSISVMGKFSLKCHELPSWWRASRL